MRNYQKSDFKKGQKIYLYVTGNKARRTKPGIENRIREAVVKTVGRKYITGGYPDRQYCEAKFEIDNDFRQFYYFRQSTPPDQLDQTGVNASQL